MSQTKPPRIHWHRSGHASTGDTVCGYQFRVDRNPDLECSPEERWVVSLNHTTCPAPEPLPVGWAPTEPAAIETAWALWLRILNPDDPFPLNVP